NCSITSPRMCGPAEPAYRASISAKPPPSVRRIHRMQRCRAVSRAPNWRLGSTSTRMMKVRRTTIWRPEAGALLSRRARLLPALLFLLASPAGFAQAPAASAALPDCGDWRDLGLPQRIEAPAQPAEALLLIEEIGWALEARRADE